jgi:Spy/CpxP family protein refolding chaperone
MKASTQKQLNIRSDAAYARAHRLARARNVSVTAVVEQALEKLEGRTDQQISKRLTPEQAAENGSKLMEALEEMWGPEGPPQGLSSDHSWLYDENGLPK